MNQKAAPRTSDDYDLEIATMKQCKRLIRRCGDIEMRKRIVQYLQGAVLAEANGKGDPALPPPPPDPRQTALPTDEGF